jgi:hypothetical protein
MDVRLVLKSIGSGRLALFVDLHDRNKYVEGRNDREDVT